MNLLIDGRKVTAVPGLTLLELLKLSGLDNPLFSVRPIAAKIAGEVFNLNYIPMRINHPGSERTSIRRAMAASGGVVSLIRYSDPSGKDVYSRTVQFVLCLAMHRLWPNTRVKINFSVGRALFVEVFDQPNFAVDILKTQVMHLINQDIPLIRRRVSTSSAIESYRKRGQLDKARLLYWRKESYFDEYAYGDFSDYYYGELAPSTGYIQVWDILPAKGGFLFLYPDDQFPDRVATFVDGPKYSSVCREGTRWCELMECETVADLNDLTRSGRIRELIRVNEALHEKRFSQVADMICHRNARILMLAGPSSSGKTTSANRLATQLRVHGKHPVLISLDDYYIDRSLIHPGPDGQIDFEHINTIDTDLFRRQVGELLDGQSVTLPKFNFITGKREWHGESLSLLDSSVVIVEGLHALNPTLLPENIDNSSVFRLYVSPLLPLNLDDHNRIPSSLLRLLRRIVRDFEGRGATVQKTLSMWDSVRRGEKRWIFPFQENADIIFNSSTLYELSVLKKHIYPLLLRIEPEDDCYEAVRSVVKILNYVQEADVDDEIPPTSLVREFIGGNSFYR